jgi:hypothetical protein
MKPLALILRSIRPKLNSDTFTFSSLLVPLALVKLALSNFLEFVYVYSMFG